MKRRDRKFSAELFTALRTRLERDARWPGGAPPAELRTASGPWWKVVLIAPAAQPTGDARRDTAWLLVAYLIKEGYADPVNPDDPRMAWLLLPTEWSQRLGQLGRDMGCQVTAQPWESQPATDYLDTHFPAGT